MDKVLSIRKNNQILSLFITIQKYQKSANRTDIVNAAIQKAQDDRDRSILNWTTIASSKVRLTSVENEDFPEFIQLRVDADKYGAIVEQIKQDFNLAKGSPTPFVVKLLLINYLLFLEGSCAGIRKSLNEESDSSKEKLVEEFKQLCPEDKMNAIYELLLDIKMMDMY